MTFVRLRQSLAAVAGTKPTASCALFHMYVWQYRYRLYWFLRLFHDIALWHLGPLVCGADVHSKRALCSAATDRVTVWCHTVNCQWQDVFGSIGCCATNLERSATDVIFTHSHCYPFLETLLSAILSWHFVPTISRFLMLQHCDRLWDSTSYLGHSKNWD